MSGWVTPRAPTSSCTQRADSRSSSTIEMRTGADSARSSSPAATRVPGETSTGDGRASLPIGPIAPWIAVAVFGVGIVVYNCGRRDSILWILLVLYSAYGGQVIGDVFFGGVLSAFVGALVMTPVAVLVARQRTGPPAVVSFLPAFWLLVPGAIGLVGVATLLGGDQAGVDTLVTTASTMVAIALGILAGSAITGRLRSSRGPLL